MDMNIMTLAVLGAMGNDNRLQVDGMQPMEEQEIPNQPVPVPS